MSSFFYYLENLLDKESTPNVIMFLKEMWFMTITEISEKYDLSQDTLRYYERIGLIPKVNRNKSGIRDYTENDCKWVEFAKCMRLAGLPIEVLIDYVSLFQQGDDTSVARKAILVEQRDILAKRLEDMQKTFDRLNYKIDRYEKILLSKEKDLINTP